MPERPAQHRVPLVTSRLVDAAGRSRVDERVDAARNGGVRFRVRERLPGVGVLALVSPEAADPGRRVLYVDCLLYTSLIIAISSRAAAAPSRSIFQAACKVSSRAAVISARESATQFWTVCFSARYEPCV